MSTVTKIQIDSEVFELVGQLEDISIVDSFVKLNKVGSGSGEARIYIGPQTFNYQEYFNNYRDKCFFLKEDLKQYLDSARVEYAAQEQKYRRDISVYLPRHYSELESFPDKIYFDLEGAIGIHDRSRYYIRSYDDIFREYFRKIALPVITHLSILKLKDNAGTYFFYFRPFLESTYDHLHHPLKIKEEEEIIQSDDSITTTQKDQLVKARFGQGKYREKLIELMSECVITRVNDERILVASHIKPWSISSDIERMDPYNGLAFTPTYDKLFDQGFMSFEDDGTLIVSPYISPLNIRKLNLTSGKKYTIIVDDKRNKYLKYHREHIFKK